ncbi:MAG: class I SAM-dependent methyltransferase [Chloroflexi bacterium]|nr:class I SAM-dependent methyltransferase [Chloroflexota bacterium]
MMSRALTWEQSVQWLRAQPDQQPLVRDCYFDDPLLDAAQRFYESAEWHATRQWLPPTPAWALDLGAGRGVGSYALARDGWRVMALEPDPSSLVGSRAISDLARQTSLPIFPIQNFAETLPFRSNSFELIYGRQVLHHALNLTAMCREVNRGLKPGGLFVATREHIISKREDLKAFLQKHPLHHLYGGENAYLLDDYMAAIKSSGLKIIKVIRSLESVVNYFPISDEEWREACRRPLARRLGVRLTLALTNPDSTFGCWLINRLASYLSWRDNSAGRLYSFVAVKP